jgi:hypothetical protein
MIQKLFQFLLVGIHSDIEPMYPVAHEIQTLLSALNRSTFLEVPHFAISYFVNRSQKEVPIIASNPEIRSSGKSGYHLIGLKKDSEGKGGR